MSFETITNDNWLSYAMKHYDNPTLEKDVEFNDGKKVKVKPQIASAVMDKFNSYRTTDEKLKFQQKIAKSYKDLLSALKEK